MKTLAPPATATRPTKPSEVVAVPVVVSLDLSRSWPCQTLHEDRRAFAQADTRRVPPHYREREAAASYLPPSPVQGPSFLGNERAPASVRRRPDWSDRTKLLAAPFPTQTPAPTG